MRGAIPSTQIRITFWRGFVCGQLCAQLDFGLSLPWFEPLSGLNCGGRLNRVAWLQIALAWIKSCAKRPGGLLFSMRPWWHGNA
jgi:hypothetical protein